MSIEVFDERKCSLGEGPLWHPERNELLWFDIFEKKLCSSSGDQWIFDEYVSAAGWIDYDGLLLATESGLHRFSLKDGSHALLVPVEADNFETRSNDGRADPNGGFWFGTMGKFITPEVGKIYRYYHGETRVIRDKVTIPNALCFSRCREWAYYADTALHQVFRHRVQRDTGWPIGAAELFLDFTEDGRNPDGAIVDAQGCLWVAMFGTGRIDGFGADGTPCGSFVMPTLNPTCPAFGGPDFSQLYVTTATYGLDDATLTTSDPAGKTFVFTRGPTGQAEPAVCVP